MKGKGNSVKAVGVKVGVVNYSFDLIQVAPLVASAKTIPVGQLRLDSQVGCGEEFIYGYGKWRNVCKDFESSSGQLKSHRDRK